MPKNHLFYQITAQQTFGQGFFLVLALDPNTVSESPPISDLTQAGSWIAEHFDNDTDLFQEETTQ